MGIGDATAFNHVGLCVTDIARSRQFYEEVLGFRYLYEINPPDEPSNRLLAMEAPVGLTAVYLRLDGFILELLHYDRAGNPPARVRVMNEPGLTHLSISVTDIDAVLAQVPAHGGTVLTDTHIGAAVMIRDPDGQLVELLPMAFRETMAAKGF